ncbi:MAG: LysR family transcriptional regulator substrate-binding protein, partial [Porticoccaceae bacterium]
IKMMVSVGLGWGMLPATMIDHSLRPLACPGLTITRQLGYIHHREKSLSNATRAFVGLLEAAADSSP